MEVRELPALAPAMPDDEDSLLFQLCFYYGLLVLLLEVVVPLVFRRRLRLVLPAAVRLLQPPQPPLSAAAFAQQKTQLGARIRDLQHAASATNKTRRRKSLATTPAERAASVTTRKRATASERRASRATTAVAEERRARSTGKLKAKRTDAFGGSSSSGGNGGVSISASARLLELRRLRDDLDRRSAALGGGLSPILQPSSLQSSYSERSSRTTASAESTSASPTTPAPEELRALSSEKRFGIRVTLSSATSLSEAQQRETWRELRRRGWQNEDAGAEEEETKEREVLEHGDADGSEPQASPSYSVSSYRSGVYATATTGRSFSEQAKVATQRERKRSTDVEYVARSTRSVPALSAEEEEEEEEYQPFHYEESRYSDDDERVEDVDFDAPQRSIGRFAPMHQSLFDESDEEFLTVIRRPRSPVAVAPSRAFTRFGDEQMDVERTIAAAFGGRPRGGRAAATAYYQPQRRQFVTGRRENAGDEAPAQPPNAAAQRSATVSSHNYEHVVRDRTPRIIRRIAFDEEMMALAATPEPRAYAAMAQAAQEATFTPAGEKRKHSAIFSPEDEAPHFGRRRTRL